MPDLNYILTTIFPSLKNVGLDRPYDNLGVNGARLVNTNDKGDLTEVTTYSDTASSNFFFDIVLRNMFPNNFNNTTLLDQVAMLEPEYVILWIGNNDVLSYLITGGNDVITEGTKFQDELDRVIARLRADTDAEIVMANVPVNPKFLAYACALGGVAEDGGAFVGGVPMLFDPNTLEAIDFGGGDYEPLEIDGTPARLLLTAAAAYIQTGAGIPSGLEQAKLDLLEESGVTLPSTYTSISGDLFLNDDEETAIETNVVVFNGIIESAAVAAGIPLLDVYDLFDSDTFETGEYAGVATLDYVLKPGAQDTTIFSLDGVHPSNLGHAIVANAFIKKMNEELHLSITEITDFTQFTGQYQSLDLRARSLDAVWGVRRLYGN